VLLLFLVLCFGLVDGRSSRNNPVFFVQDPNDGLCLAGSEFKRCGVETLWFVEGNPGKYEIHRRGVDDKSEDLCLDRKTCDTPTSEVRLASCSHCGAKRWNILGDESTGYVLSENGQEFCMKRDEHTELPTLIKCDDGFTTLSLHFASKYEIQVMESPGALLVAASAEGDVSKVKQLIDEDGVEVDSFDWDRVTPLIAAATTGQLEVIEVLMGHGPDVSAGDKDGITALMEAASNGNLEVVQFLVDRNAEVDQTSSSGVTALWLAAGEGHIAVVNYLIEQGADATISRSDGISANMAACVGGHLPVVEALLDAGADVEERDHDDVTPLMNAAENGTIPLIELLIEHGADVSALSSSGFTPLIVAAAGGHLDVVKIFLAKGADVNAMHDEGVDALMYAAAGGHTDVVKCLVEHGANVNQLHIQGGSALMEAATAGSLDVIQVLVDAGADVLLKDNDGVTPLMSSASQGHLNVTEFLIEKNVEVNAKANSGGTALMFASAGGYFEVCEYLIKKGANVNEAAIATQEYIDQINEAIQAGNNDVEPHQNGVTSLMVAALGGHEKVVKLLLDNGADAAVVDEEGTSALMNAIKGNYGDVSVMLVEAGANPNDVYIDEDGKKHDLLMDALHVANEEFATLLIQRGASADNKDRKGRTPLIMAAEAGMASTVEALLESGSVDVEAETKAGDTALLRAAFHGYSEIVELLVVKGKAKIHKRDKDGSNALMIASVRGHRDVVEVLIDNGIKIDLFNKEGHTALMFAYHGRSQANQLIESYGDYLDENKNSTISVLDMFENHNDIVDILLENGADPSIQDKEGHVAADFDFKMHPTSTDGSSSNIHEDL